jgi:hypothetical protein
MTSSANCVRGANRLVLGAIAVLVACGPEVEHGSTSDFTQEVTTACSYACALEQECSEERIDVAVCILRCDDDIEHRMPPRPPCDEARLTLVECKGTLDCDELAEFASGAANPCSEEQAEVDACE